MHGPLTEPYAILSLSLGTTRDFDIRESRSQKFVTTIPLRHGDIVAMNGVFQRNYQHRFAYVFIQSRFYETITWCSVPKMRRVWGPRINLTFRYIKCHTKGRACCGGPASLTPNFIASFPHSSASNYGRSVTTPLPISRNRCSLPVSMDLPVTSADSSQPSTAGGHDDTMTSRQPRSSTLSVSQVQFF